MVHRSLIFSFFNLQFQNNCALKRTNDAKKVVLNEASKINNKKCYLTLNCYESRSCLVMLLFCFFGDTDAAWCLLLITFFVAMKFLNYTKTPYLVTRINHGNKFFSKLFRVHVITYFQWFSDIRFFMLILKLILC